MEVRDAGKRKVGPRGHALRTLGQSDEKREAAVEAPELKASGDAAAVGVLEQNQATH